MNKNIKGLIVVLIVGGAAYFAYKNFSKDKYKKIVINHLDANFGKDIDHTNFINNANKDYVKEWAKAITKGLSTFVYGGKTYKTNGGTAL
jgi:predicted negative regulator of RcsB-dependent stress response